MCHLFAIFFYKNKSVLPPTHVPGAGIFGIPSIEVFSDPLYRVVSQLLHLQMAISDFTTDFDLAM